MLADFTDLINKTRRRNTLKRKRSKAGLAFQVRGGGGTQDRGHCIKTDESTTVEAGKYRPADSKGGIAFPRLNSQTQRSRGKKRSSM